MRVEPVAFTHPRWRLTVTDEELHDIHHALRMLLKHPFQPRGDEHDRLTASADAIWNAHCNRLAPPRGSGKPQ